MSLLTQTKTRDDIIADKLKAAPKQIFDQLFQNWKMNFDLLWDHADPQVILDKLGTSGQEVFLLSAGVVQYLESQKPGCTTATLAKMKACDYNQDGSVSLQPEA